MLQFLEILKLALSLLPIVHDAVAQVELLFPQGGNGAKKLDMVKGIIEQAMSVTGAASGAFSSVWPVLETAISGIVSLKKAVTGNSPTSSASAPATTAADPKATDTPTFGWGQVPNDATIG